MKENQNSHKVNTLSVHFHSFESVWVVSLVFVNRPRVRRSRRESFSLRKRCETPGHTHTHTHTHTHRTQQENIGRTFIDLITGPRRGLCVTRRPADVRNEPWPLTQQRPIKGRSSAGRRPPPPPPPPPRPNSRHQPGRDRLVKNLDENTAQRAENR